MTLLNDIKHKYTTKNKLIFIKKNLKILYDVFDFKNNYFIIKKIKNSSKIYVFALFEIFNVKLYMFLF